MLNVMKMDLERMKRTKSMYVILLIFAAIAVLNVFMLNLDHTMEEDGFEIGQEQVQQEMINIGITVQHEGEQITLASAMIAMCTSGFMLLFTGIFTALFVVGESSTGYIKNIASCVRGRWKLILSKNIVIITFVILEFVVLLLGTAIGILLFIEEPSFGVTKEMLVVIGLQGVLHMGFAVFGVFVATLLRSKAMSMIVLIMASTGFGILLVSIVDQLLNKMNITISNYLLSHNVMILNTIPTNDVIRRIFLVFFIAILVYNVCSGIIMEKRDIR